MLTQGFIAGLVEIVGRNYVYTDPRRTEWYPTGFRSGGGDAEAVILPGTLLEFWKVLQACVSADKIVIVQAANTGLTEGSTPSGEYDRDVFIINTLRPFWEAAVKSKPCGRYASRPGEVAEAAGQAASFGDRLVLYRRLDCWRGLQ